MKSKKNKKGKENGDCKNNPCEEKLKMREENENVEHLYHLGEKFYKEVEKNKEK